MLDIGGLWLSAELHEWHHVAPWTTGIIFRRGIPEQSQSPPTRCTQRLVSQYPTGLSPSATRFFLTSAYWVETIRAVATCHLKVSSPPTESILVQGTNPSAKNTTTECTGNDWHSWHANPTQQRTDGCCICAVAAVVLVSTQVACTPKMGRAAGFGALYEKKQLIEADETP